VISKPTIKLQKPHRDVRKYSALCLHTRRKRPQQHAEQRQIQQNQGREFLFFIDLISKQYRSFLNISPHLFQKGISNPYTTLKLLHNPTSKSLRRLSSAFTEELFRFRPGFLNSPKIKQFGVSLSGLLGVIK
jgi:hypothetical protein